MLVGCCHSVGRVVPLFWMGGVALVLAGCYCHGVWSGVVIVLVGCFLSVSRVFP